MLPVLLFGAYVKHMCHLSDVGSPLMLGCQPQQISRYLPEKARRDYSLSRVLDYKSKPLLPR